MAEPAVKTSALVQCSFGLAPSTLEAQGTVTVEGTPAATIMDSTIINIPPFGSCTSLANPEVASATAAALGVLTPMPCIPALTPWVPGSPTVLIEGQPALVAGSTCVCAFGGVVEITFPGTVRTLM